VLALYQIIKLALASASNPKIASFRLLLSLGDEYNFRVDNIPTHVLNQKIAWHNVQHTSGTLGGEEISRV